MNDTLKTYAAIAAGSVAGSLLRWAADLLIPLWVDPAFPWSTLFVNVAGSFIISYYAARFPAAGPLARHFVMTGLCGGFTTFSTFGLGAFNLLRIDAGAQALAYAGLTLAGAMLAVWLGDVFGKGRKPA
jgi:CrcB protein